MAKLGAQVNLHSCALLDQTIILDTYIVMIQHIELHWQ